MDNNNNGTTATAEQPKENSLSLEAVSEIVKDRASKKLRKELYDVFQTLRGPLLQSQTFCNGQTFPAEVAEFSKKMWVDMRYLESSREEHHNVTGDLSKQLYDYWLPKYIEDETKAFLEEVNSYIYYKNHPEAKDE